MATHSSVLVWRIPGMGKPGGLPSMGSHRVGHNWSYLAAAAEKYKRSEQFFKIVANPECLHTWATDSTSVRTMLWPLVWVTLLCLEQWQGYQATGVRTLSRGMEFVQKGNEMRRGAHAHCAKPCLIQHFVWHLAHYRFKLLNFNNILEPDSTGTS